MSASIVPRIIPIQASHYTEWARLFRNYVDFYKSSLPETQYQNTFDRLIDPEKDLYGLVLPDPQNENKLLGLAHYYPHQTPWNDKPIMHLNDLFIDPAVRGGGYGRKMILKVAEEAKERGCFRLEWATQHGNPARKLYDQLATCDFVEYRMKLE